MKFFSLGLLLTLITSVATSQEHNDVGILSGASYYMGDFNRTTQFYQPSPAIGVFLRHNLNEFYSLKIGGTYGHVKGTHNPSSYYLPGITQETSFESRQVVEFGSALEIGFRPFNTRPSKKRLKISPYVTMGVGFALIDRDFIVNFPFGVGLKYSPFNRWTFGFEWRLHKTLNDNIDHYSPLQSQNAQSFRFHNFDWIGFGGLFVSYRLVKKGAICPAYQ